MWEFVSLPHCCSKVTNAKAFEVRLTYQRHSLPVRSCDKVQSVTIYAVERSAVQYGLSTV